MIKITAAHKALSLKQDMVFRLLIIMTALLGWIAGTGAAAVAGLNEIYAEWQLENASRISIYLPAASEKTEVEKLMAQLRTDENVNDVHKLEQVELEAILGQNFSNIGGLPLPVVIDLKVEQEFDRMELDEQLDAMFPTAEIDDSREVLSAVGNGVRMAQGIGFMLALVVFMVMGLLVAITVTAGLRNHKETLGILQYIGSTDGFLTRLVVQQVFMRSLFGWAIAIGLIVISILIITYQRPNLEDYMTSQTWIIALITPLLLPFVAIVVARLSTAQNIKTTLK